MLYCSRASQEEMAIMVEYVKHLLECVSYRVTEVEDLDYYISQQVCVNKFAYWSQNLPTSTHGWFIHSLRG